MPTAYHHIGCMCVNPVEILEQKLSVKKEKKRKIYFIKIKNIHSNISGGKHLTLTSL